MTDTFSEDRWNIFENSGRVADYLYYRGIGVKKLSEGAVKNAQDSVRSGNRSEGAGGQ